MAVTAGGVAIGNVAGTALTNAIFGSSSDSAPAAQAAPAAPAPAAATPAPAAAPAPVPQQQACALELQDFIKCTQTQSDITLCAGFNQILKDCKEKVQMSN